MDGADGTGHAHGAHARVHACARARASVLVRSRARALALPRRLTRTPHPASPGRPATLLHGRRPPASAVPDPGCGEASPLIGLPYGRSVRGMPHHVDAYSPAWLDMLPCAAGQGFIVMTYTVMACTVMVLICAVSCCRTRRSASATKPVHQARPDRPRRDGTGRIGTGQDGTGRAGTGWDGLGMHGASARDGCMHGPHARL